MPKVSPFKVRKSQNRAKPPAPKTKPAPAKKQPLSHIKMVCNRAAAIQAQIEACKPLYRKLDEYMDYLAHRDLRGTGFVMVDAFEGKGNTAWKSVAFRRFELVRGGK